MNYGELAKALFERRSAVVYVEAVSDPTWNGQPNQCHENVQRWTMRNPSHCLVRGFLVISDTIFELHSIVAREDGSLLDVTPLSWRCPFIRLEMSEEEFAEYRRRYSQLIYPLTGLSNVPIPQQDEDEPGDMAW